AGATECAARFTVAEVVRIGKGRERLMTTGHLAEWLGHTLLFDGLDPHELARLATISRETKLANGEVLFNQGDESDGLSLVENALIRLYLTAEDSREATINLLEDGEVIGEMSLLDGLPRSAGAAAVTPPKLLFIPRAPLRERRD